MMMLPVLAVFSLLLSCAAAETNGTCDLKCHHNATCVEGEADFSNHPVIDGQPLDIHTEVISPNGWRCDCPDGKTGLKCGRTYIGCENKDHKCYNGGKCIPGAKDRFGNDQDFCDCNEAINNKGVKHVGKYCEIPVPVLCGGNGTDADPDVFCVNGGYCKEKWRDEPHRPCRCGSKHDGPHCEYRKGEIPDCTLQCANGGQCKLGIKNWKMAGFDYQNFWRNTTDAFMHCVCPQDYFGLTCDVESKECGDHHCFNGGTCVAVGAEVDGITQECDCTTAKKGNSSFAGRFCQYESTDFCDKELGPNGLQFCANGGTCKTVGDNLGRDIVECDCPNGFHGPVCEYRDDENNDGFVTCNLQCHNGGQCRKGAKDVSFLNKFNLGLSGSTLNVTHNEDFEHCVCPNGFVGHTCDTAFEICGDDKHICLGGDKCVQDGDGHKCDSVASTSSGKSSSGGGKNVPAIVLSVLVVGAVASGVAFAYRWRWSRSGRDTNFVEKAVFPAETSTSDSNTTPQVDVGPEKDLDGNELENVEII